MQSVCKTIVPKMYNEIIEDVISNIENMCNLEGIDHQVPEDLKAIWQSKVRASGAVYKQQDQNASEPSETDPLANTSNTELITHFAIENQSASDIVFTTQPLVRNLDISNTESNTQPVGQEPSVSNIVFNIQPVDPRPSTSNIVFAQPAEKPSTRKRVAKRDQKCVPQKKKKAVETEPEQQTTTQVQSFIFQPVDPTIPVQVTLPTVPSMNPEVKVLTIYVPASTMIGPQPLLHSWITGPVVAAAMGLPIPLATNLVQQHVNACLQHHQQQIIINAVVIPQVDDSSAVEPSV